MIAFIEEHPDAIGVEPICRHLPIAPSTFYDHMAKRANPDLLSDRAKRDEVLRSQIERVWEQNYKVYGVRKVWHQMRRERFDVARCTVARLMKDLGLEGVIRGKKVRTIPDNAQPCPLSVDVCDKRRPGVNNLKKLKTSENHSGRKDFNSECWHRLTRKRAAKTGSSSEKRSEYSCQIRLAGPYGSRNKDATICEFARCANQTCRV